MNERELFERKPDTKSHSASVESQDVLPVSTSEAALAILPPGVNFYDIDWEYFFGDVMHHSYEGARDYSEFQNPDGTYDFDKLRQSGRGEADILLDEHGKPDMQKIISYLTERPGQLDYEPLIFAIPDLSKVTQADQETIRQALMDKCQQLMSRGSVLQLFEFLERIFPRYFDSFQILESQLPKAARRDYINRIPILALRRDKLEDVRKLLMERGFDEGELEELSRDVLNNKDLLFYLKAIADQSQLKLKSGKFIEVKKIDSSGSIPAARLLE